MDPQSDVCADCTALFPQWASVNRGVLLCDECSAIHRQLGRHISQVKHLKKSRWRLTQLDMVRYLAAACANRYWEHVLYEPMLAGQHAARSTAPEGSNKQPATISSRKPKPADPMHPTKTDFIREKYLFLGFFKKPRNLNLDDLNQQLHASVRTGVLETSLYLLALGANPNFIHPVKGTSPMHVACHYGQLGQVEVLLAYGADFRLRDALGQTPVDVALERALSTADATGSMSASSLTYEQKLRFAWSPLVDTLVNAYYEVTDGLAYFLTRRVPDHRSALLGSAASTIVSSPVLPKRTDSLKMHNGESVAAHQNLAQPSPETCKSPRNGHFLISSSLLKIPGEPSGDGTSSADAWMQEARRRLTQLPNLAFEDLCIDVYDEADRRLMNSYLETSDSLSVLGQMTNNGFSHESGVNGDDAANFHKPSTVGGATGRGSLTLYFLPPNTSYSSIRNQARQKLGRLSAVEFHTLVLDLLTEISARLLPLFPPVPTTISPPQPSRIERSQPLQRHPYSNYLPVNSVAGLTSDDIPTSIFSRLAPLPSPPLPESPSVPGVNSDAPVESPIESMTPISNGEPDFQKDLTGVSITDCHPGKRKRATNQKGQRAHGDDPVYDQVAAESDILISLSTVRSLGPQSPTLSSCSVQNEADIPDSVGPKTVLSVSDDLRDGNTATVREPVVSDGVESSKSPSSRPSSPEQFSPHASTELSVTSRPGPIPGSRRLHLSHTSRLVQHRASVPASQPPSSRLPTELMNLSPILEAANLATESPVNRRLTPTDQPRTAADNSKHFVQPCCVAARNEVDRLRKENAALRNQVSDLQSSKEAIENRFKNLELRMRQVDSIVDALREEKSALLAAFSAGMVKSHSPPRQHQSSDGSASATQPTSSREYQGINLPGRLKKLQSTPLPTEDYEMDSDRPDDDKQEESGSYSVGSHCLDSGILLRQGIIQRSGGGSRGGSPAASTSTPSHLPSAPGLFTNPPTRSNDVHTSLPAVTNASRSSTKQAVGPYVNVSPMATPPQVGPKPSGAARLITISTHTPTMTAQTTSTVGGDDYVAPNSTGSASPAPVPLTAESGGHVGLQMHAKVKQPHHLGARCPPVLQNQHAQILSSIAALPDYDCAPSTTQPAHVSTSRLIIPSTPAVHKTEGWQNPTSDRVVRCVEAIIVRIRILVQLTNGDRTGDFVQCSLAIQSAVRDILSLFPPITDCSTNVANALADLASASQSLRPHCELIAQKLSAIPLTQRQCSAVLKSLAPEVNTLIRYAHQIAKAAKELLALFQKSS
ncbi:ARF GTPase-activating protein GIT2 [Paragonimus heterotremus]|uniref:ARF GTPase-activating protein GIT2 n=1 Tax=Paragonimus heterotremus TaxID=100268 RepID=A0A8J4WHL6_9TREM|nr:ARF GTPase-activating protein GIT2 [Paragonimus heterotremus]